MITYKTFLRTFLLLAFSGVLVSCSKEMAEVSTSDDELNEIVPGLSVKDIITGSVDDGDLEKMTFFFARGDGEEVEELTYQEAPVQADYKAPVQSGYNNNLQFIPAQYYLPDPTVTWMRGFYPYDPAETSKYSFDVDRRDGPIVTWSDMTGMEDIIVSNALTGTNTSLAINSERDKASFLFQHQLVQINFYASTEIAAADSKWGNITKMVLPDQVNEYDFYLADDTDEAFAPNSRSGADYTVAIQNTTDNIKLLAEGTGLEDATGIPTGAFVGSILIAPGQKSFFLEMETTQGSTVHEIGMERGEELEILPPEGTDAFESGHAYNICLDFKLGELTITLIATEWDSNKTNVNLGQGQETYPKVVEGENIIISRDFLGGVTTPVRDGKWTETPTSEAEDIVPAVLEVAGQDGNSSSPLAWDAAKAACPDGWRLPCRAELQLVWDCLQALYLNPDDDSNRFTLPKGTYWTATEVTGNTENAYIVDLDNGNVSDAVKTATHKVRCVRDI